MGLFAGSGCLAKVSGASKGTLAEKLRGRKRVAGGHHHVGNSLVLVVAGVRNGGLNSDFMQKINFRRILAEYI